MSIVQYVKIHKKDHKVNPKTMVKSPKLLCGIHFQKESESTEFIYVVGWLCAVVVFSSASSSSPPNVYIYVFIWLV